MLSLSESMVRKMIHLHFFQNQLPGSQLKYEHTQNEYFETCCHLYFEMHKSLQCQRNVSVLFTGW